MLDDFLSNLDGLDGETRYQAIGVLGEGALGPVLRVEDHTVGRSRALKRVHVGTAEDLRSFRREFRALVTLSHPGLVVFHEVGHDADGWFLTMEVVDGAPLAAGSLTTPEQAASVAVQIIDALRALHGADLVHGALKPEHVMVGPDGRIVLLDFGLTQTMRASNPSGVGNPRHAAPEQLYGERPSPAWDVWALGAVLYEGIEGRLPWDDAADPVFARSQLDTAARTPRGTGRLPGLIASMLAPRPEARPTLPALASTLREAGVELPRRLAVPRAGLVEAVLAPLRREGPPAFVEAHGPAGIGKSAIAEEVERRIPRDMVAVRVSGTPEDRLPLRTLGDVLDTLASRYPVRIGPALDTATPRARASLVARFPSLREAVPPRADDPRPTRDGLVQGLGHLLRGFSPLVLILDAADGVDHASISVLEEALGLVDGRPVHVVTFAEEPSLDRLAPLRGRTEPSAQVRVPVGRMTDAEIRTMVRHLRPDVADDTADSLVRIAAGCPLMVRLAIGWLGGASTLASDQLDDAVRRLLSRHPEHLRHALSLLALEPEGAPLRVWAEAAGMEPDALAEFVPGLRSEGLLSTQRTRLGGTVTIAHRCVREALLAVEDGRRSQHRDWTRVMKSWAGASPAMHYRHLVGGQLENRAWSLAHAEHDEAWGRRDWALAAWWAGAAADVSPDDADRSRLRLREVEAMALCGPSEGTAARLVRQLSSMEGCSHSLLRLRAAETALLHGDRAHALRLYDAALDDIGVQRPTGLLSSWIEGVWRLGSTRVRALAPPAVSGPVDPEHGKRIDTLFAVALGLGLTDPIPARCLQSRMTYQALAANDPARLARALSVHLLHETSASWDPARTRAVEAVLERSVESAGDPELAAWAAVCQATAAWTEGRFKEAAGHLERLRGRGLDGVLARHTTADLAHLTTLSVALSQGRLGALARGIETARAEAEDRGDHHLAMHCAVRFQPWVDLANGRVTEGRHELEAAVRQIAPDGEPWLHLHADLNRAMLTTVAGQPRRALVELDRAWRRLMLSGLMRVHHFRVKALQTRARTAAATLVVDPGHRRARVLLKRSVRALRRGPSVFSRATGTWIEAEVFRRDGGPRGDAVLDQLQLAELTLDALVAGSHADDPLPGIAAPDAWRAWFTPRALLARRAVPAQDR